MSNSTDKTQAQINASKLIKKRDLVNPELLPQKSAETTAPNLINKVGEALMNYDRVAIATKAGEFVGNLAEKGTYNLVNGTLFTGEHAVIDSVQVASDAVEVVSRKTVNGGRIAGIYIKASEQERLEQYQQQLEAVQAEVTSSSKAIALEAADRFQGFYTERVTTPREEKRRLKIQKIQEDGGTHVDKARNWVAEYTGKPVYGQQQAKLESEIAALALPESTAPEMVADVEEALSEPAKVPAKRTPNKQASLSDVARIEFAKTEA